MDALQQEIDHWSGLGVEVDWFVNADRTEAIGIGDGFAWGIDLDDKGRASTQETTLGNWTTGIEV